MKGDEGRILFEIEKRNKGKGICDLTNRALSCAGL